MSKNKMIYVYFFDIAVIVKINFFYLFVSQTPPESAKTQSKSKQRLFAMIREVKLKTKAYLLSALLWDSNLNYVFCSPFLFIMEIDY